MFCRQWGALESFGIGESSELNFWKVTLSCEQLDQSREGHRKMLLKLHLLTSDIRWHVFKQLSPGMYHWRTLGLLTLSPHDHRKIHSIKSA